MQKTQRRRNSSDYVSWKIIRRCKAKCPSAVDCWNVFGKNFTENGNEIFLINNISKQVMFATIAFGMGIDKAGNNVN